MRILVTGGAGSRYCRISEATLVEQPKGVELEYNIIAVNKAGDGPESNTVTVVP